jgi:hypothetical protein
MDKLDQALSGLSGSIMASVFRSMEEVIFASIEEEGLDKEDYFLSILPFSLTRKDGGPISTKLLKNLQKKLSTTNTN